jgi:hypothetical protein
MQVSVPRAKWLWLLACAAASSCVGPGLEPPGPGAAPTPPQGPIAGSAAHDSENAAGGGPTKNPVATSDAGVGAVGADRDNDGGAADDEDAGTVIKR